MSVKEESDYPDKGINEVLQRTKDLNLGREANENLTEPRQDNGEAEKFEQAAAHRETNASNLAFGDTEATPNIDFSDPEKVLCMLETVDLSEEDTEFLLQEAYKVNKKLKDILRQQERESSSCPPDVQRQKMRVKREKGSSPSNSGTRSESASFSASKPLPPILCDRQPTDIYAVKLKRSRTNIPITNSQPTVVAERSKSSKGPSRIDARQSQPKRKTRAEEKPDWNNRFNYT